MPDRRTASTDLEDLLREQREFQRYAQEQIVRLQREVNSLRARVAALETATAQPSAPVFPQ